MRRRLPLILLVIATFCAVVRLTIRDRVIGLSTLFYASPPLLIAVLPLVAGLIWWRRSERRRAGLALVAGVALAAWGGAAHQARGTPDPGATRDARVLLWNLRYATLAEPPEIAAQIAAQAPDIVALVESPPGEQIAAGLPGYEMRWFGGGIVLLVRGSIEEASSWDVPGRIRTGSATVTLATGRRIDLIIVDIKSNPLLSRADVFAHLRRRLEVPRQRPLLLIGDFNTPLDSVHFDELRETLRFTHAYESAGHGYMATWPVPLPVLPIDHVWGGPRVRFTRAELTYGLASDHRAVVADFVVR